MISSEILFKHNPYRFSVFPIRHNEIWKMYKKAEASFWHASEINLTLDLAEWKKLNGDVQHFIKYVLAYFAASDGLVNENIASRYMRYIQLPEARCFYGFQIAIENVHAEVYGKMIDVLITDVGEKEKLFRAIETIPVIKDKAIWAQKWIKNLPLDENKFEQLSSLIAENILSAQTGHSSGDYAEQMKRIHEKVKSGGDASNSPLYDDYIKIMGALGEEFTEKDLIRGLVAFAVVEGIFFSGAFCAIYYLNEQGIMKQLGKANDFIARDEALHAQFACLLYSMIENKLDADEVYDMVHEAVCLESNFIIDALPCRLIGMNSDLMKQYVRFCANRLLVQLGYEELYPDVEQPFEFMKRIELKNKSNFFEIEPTEYGKKVESDTKNTFDDLEKFLE